MKLEQPTDAESLECKLNYRYSLAYTSSNRIWFIGAKPVIYGVRAIAWRKDSVGPCLDYCTGDDVELLIGVIRSMIAIFRQLPEDISEKEVIALFPQWNLRPINRDKCWPALQQLAEQYRQSTIPNNNHE